MGIESQPAQYSCSGCAQQAIEDRKPLPGLVHHSDRGVQYASHDYTELLRKHGAICSMSRAGNPYDNARCESFLKTLKQEEIYCREYRDLEICAATAAHSSTNTTTVSACIRRSAIFRPQRSRRLQQRRQPSSQDEFCKA